MKLFLVQHGESMPEAADPNRPLTENGRADVSMVANFLKGKVTIDIIWHSTKLRARQTAGLIAGILPPGKGVSEKPGLAPNDPVNKIMDDILKENLENLMITGHLPFLSRLASLLLADSESQNIVGFRQGGVVCLERTDKGGWIVAWAVVPGLVGDNV